MSSQRPNAKPAPPVKGTAACLRALKMSFTQQTYAPKLSLLRNMAVDSEHVAKPFPSRIYRRWYFWLAAFLILTGAAFVPLLWQWRVEAIYASSTFLLEQAPSKRVAIVLGARVYANGRLSGMLRDRVETAVALYRAGKVEKILMSGDNSHADYNEPGAMVEYAISMGVDPADIQPDYGGRRTYDTCYRAKHIFQVDEAIVVTQAFHLPRALFLCDHLGIDAVGVVADQRRYDPRSIAWSESRELPATLTALNDVIRRAPPPVLGEPIPIH